MLESIVRYNVNFIVNELGLKDEIKIDRIRYGIEVLIAETFKMSFIFMVAVLIKKQSEFFIITSLLVIIRGSIGGSHAKNMTGCFIKSNLLFISLYFLGSTIKNIGITIELITIIIVIMTLKDVKYRTKIDKSGKDELKNKKLRKKLISVSMIYLIISKIFFYEYYSLVFVTIVFIILDYLKVEGVFYEKKS